MTWLTLLLMIAMAGIGALEFGLRHYALATLDAFCVLFLLIVAITGGLR